ncbi:PbsX family transcriptional regulator [uncultured Vagococcus sp.]|uniref:AbrB/MazE/SpoVT family DNA-binding domain-containing protein n=1 Tax=uncultured Vagococcus sp. TaxID=189676 RepID=UPI00258722FC|nr:PbsX family transcriptional regulator [uncultured Vagococcus sp.]
MEMTRIKKWGNSNGIILPKNIMEFLDVHTQDKLKISQEEVEGKKRLVIEAINLESELSIEQLFEGYTEEKLQVEVLDLGEPVGHEKW